MAVLVTSIPFVSVFVETAQAQINEEINYQGKLTDNTGQTVANGTYNIRFKLYTVPIGGSEVWSETTTVEVTNGLFSYLLGSSSDLTSVNFNDTLYIGVEIGGTGAPSWDGEMTPRKRLGAVPAAFEAQNAQTLDGIATSSFARSDEADTISGLFTFTGGLISNSSSTITDLMAVNATTTNLYVNSALTLASVTSGPLAANGSGAVSASSTLQDPYISDTLTIGVGSTFANDVITADSIVSTGQADGECLTWSTGDVLAWESCSSGALTSADIDTSSELAGIVTDETGSGALVFATTPTFNTQITSPIYDGTTDSTAILRADTDVIIDLDDDNDGSETFIIRDGGDNPRFVVNESGNVTTGTWNASFANDVITPDSIVSTGQADGECLTWSTGDVLAWESCGGGASFGSDNQVPYTNSGGNDFDYSSTFTYNGTLLSLHKSGGGAADLFHLRDTTDANDLVIRYNGDRFDIRSETAGNGNLIMSLGGDSVGIGTASPGAKLDIAESEDLTAVTSRLTYNGATNTGAADDFAQQDFYYSGGAYDYLSAQIAAVRDEANDSGALAFRTRDGSSDILATRMYIDNDGNVGIGTTSPVVKLDVVGGTTIVDKYFYIRDYDDGTISNPTRMISRDGNFQFWNGGVIVGSYSDGAVADLGDGNMVISGNVGIGTNAPTASLDINNQLFLGDDTTNTDILFDTNGYLAAEGDLWINIDGDNNETDSALYFRTDSYGGSGGTTLLSILESGAVGIGTSNPESALHIANNVGSGFDAFSDFQILLYDSGSAASSYGIGIEGSTMMFNSNEDYSFYVAGTEQITFDNGSVGIGTNNPDYTLDLVDDGDIGGLDMLVGYNDLRLYGDSTGGPDVYIGSGGCVAVGASSCNVALDITGDVEATGFIAADDIRELNGQQLVLNAGESAGYATGQTSEYVYINAENGLQINSSDDNWGSGWSGRHTGNLVDSNGNSSLPGDLVLSNGGNLTFTANATAQSNVLCRDASGASEIHVCTSFGFDYAEMFPTDGELDHAEIAMTSDETYDQGPTSTVSILKKAIRNEGKVVGITVFNYFEISNASLRNIPEEQSPIPIALMGRVPLKVNLDEGPIAIGDAITLSYTEAGVGTKATTTGLKIGYALEPFPNEKDNGTVLVYVDNSTHITGADLVRITDLSLDLAEHSTSTFDRILESGEDTIWTRLVTLAQAFVDGVLTVTKLSSISVISQSINAESVDSRNISSERVNTEEICVGSVCVDEATFLEMVEANAVGATNSSQMSNQSTATDQEREGFGTSEEDIIHGTVVVNENDQNSVIHDTSRASSTEVPIPVDSGSTTSSSTGAASTSIDSTSEGEEQTASSSANAEPTSDESTADNNAPAPDPIPTDVAVGETEAPPPEATSGNEPASPNESNAIPEEGAQTGADQSL